MKQTVLIVRLREKRRSSRSRLTELEVWSSLGFNRVSLKQFNKLKERHRLESIPNSCRIFKKPIQSKVQNLKEQIILLNLFQLNPNQWIRVEKYVLMISKSFPKRPMNHLNLERGILCIEAEVQTTMGLEDLDQNMF